MLCPGCKAKIDRNAVISKLRDQRLVVFALSFVVLIYEAEMGRPTTTLLSLSLLLVCAVFLFGVLSRCLRLAIGNDDDSRAADE